MVSDPYHTRRQFIAKAGYSALGFTALNYISCSLKSIKTRKPNILLIYTDDQGYGDLGCYGAEDLITPNIDALAAKGIKMTHFYSCSPVCSPARAGLLTGRYPDRTGVLGVLRKHHDDIGLNLNEITIADILSQHGYVTGLCGKWHLGVGPKYRPLARGFQYAFGPLNGAIDYYTHLSIGGGLDGQACMYRNDEPVSEEGYFTDLVTQEALEFIDRNHSQPFFLYLPYTAPHKPLQVPDEYRQPFLSLKRVNPHRATYAAMLYCLDKGVGQIVERLESLGIRGKSIIIYLSDNGWGRRGKEERASSNGGLEGGKYYLTEGGIRVPCIISIPGITGSVCDVPAINLDLFTTTLSLAHCDIPKDRVIDGLDLSAILDVCSQSIDRDLFWRFRDDRVGTGDQWAVRSGRWKLQFIDDEMHLYNVVDDPAESHDVIADYPQIILQLKQKYDCWNASLPPRDWKS